jgi:RHS repeat-associated protein
MLPARWGTRDANGQILAVYEKEFVSIDEETIPNPEWPDIDEWPPAEADFITLFKTAEYHLYGSDRLGLHLYEDTVAAHVFSTADGDGAYGENGYFEDTTQLTPTYPIPYIEPRSDGTWFYTFTRGRKRYELTNHLGNVLETVSDRKLQVEGEEVATCYTADVWAMSDYYAFGMLMPGRNMRRGEYRFGFNGMEGDDEMKGLGNSYDFGARMYDSRIGRWLSRDPAEVKYPSMSPYNAFNDNPMLYIDPDGNDGRISIIVNQEYKTIHIAVATDVYVFGSEASSDHVKWLNRYWKHLAAPNSELNLSKKVFGLDPTETDGYTVSVSIEVNYKDAIEKISDTGARGRHGLLQINRIPSETKEEIGFQRGDNILEIGTESWANSSGPEAGAAAFTIMLGACRRTPGQFIFLHRVPPAMIKGKKVVI